MKCMQARSVGGRIAMIEKVEKGRLSEGCLLLYQSLRRPAIESVAGGRENALVQVLTGIEAQEFGGEIAVSFTDDPFVVCRARGIGGEPGT